MAPGFALIRVALLAVILGLGVGACGTTCACTAPPPPPIDGVVISVNATGLTVIHDFTLRLGDGSTMTFVLGPLENATQFSPGHLKEHQASGSPIRVFFTRDSTGLLVVYRLEDAPVPSSSP